MPRFCANLSMLFTELPFLDRIAAAGAAGFEGVEVLFPYDVPAPRILDRLDATGLPLVLINCPPPNYAGGPRGFAAVPGLEERFRTDFRRAARFAATLGARHVHVMAGVAEGPGACTAFVANLAWAAAAAPSLSLTIEPINRDDVPGYFLADFGLALEVLDQVGAPNLRLQFDAYHARLTAWDNYLIRVDITETPRVCPAAGPTRPTKMWRHRFPSRQRQLQAGVLYPPPGRAGVRRGNPGAAAGSGLSASVTDRSSCCQRCCR